MVLIFGILPYPYDIVGQAFFCPVVLFSQNLCCSNPCWNNAKCLLGFTDKKYLCVCTSGYTGEHCETGIVEKLIVTGHIAGNNMQ